MKRLVRILLLCFLVSLIFGCSNEEKYVTTVFDENIKSREYKDRIEYLFFDEAVSMTIQNDSLIELNSLLTFEEGKKYYILNPEIFGDIGFGVGNKEDSKNYCAYTVTKDVLVEEYSLVLEKNGIKIGRMCDPTLSEDELTQLDDIVFIIK